jgi:drug/metabolite transporter (DMT)-like permease
MVIVMQANRHLKDTHKAYISLIISVLGFTFGTSFLKLALLSGVPASVIVMDRLLLSCLFLTPFALSRLRSGRTSLTTSDWLWSAVAGALMATHLILIVDSLRFTTIMFNQVIVNTGPMWVALMEVFFLRARFSKLVWGGLAIALAGSAFILVAGVLENNLGTAPDIGLGNLLALISAIFAASYIIMGRRLRQKISILPYLWIMFGVGGAVAAGYNMLTQTPLGGYTSEGYFWIVMVTIFPTLIGHAFFNFALGYLSATIVTLSGQIVILTASLAGALVFSEYPTPLSIVASSVIVTGVSVAILGQNGGFISKRVLPPKI